MDGKIGVHFLFLNITEVEGCQTFTAAGCVCAMANRCGFVVDKWHEYGYYP
jgi:hypothetical protein